MVMSQKLLMSEEAVKSVATKENRLFISPDQYSTVDSSLLGFLKQFNWRVDKPNNTKKYAITTINQKTVRLHRLIMLASKNEVVDHIDGNPMNNLSENLRIVTKSQNMHNRFPNKDNTSGYKGVVRHGEKWRAQVRFNGKLYYFGFYENLKEAAKAYNKGAKKLFGKYARLNNI